MKVVGRAALPRVPAFNHIDNDAEGKLAKPLRPPGPFATPQSWRTRVVDPRKR
jgi:hypothetical protein